MSRIIISTLCIIILSLAAASCSGTGPVHPAADNGILDLRHWNFSHDGPVALSGEWIFLWKRLLTMNEMKSPVPLKGNVYPVPARWYYNTLKDGRTIDRRGYATYILRVKINPAGKNSIVKIYNQTIENAYTLYYRDLATGKLKLLLKSGTVGTDRNNSRAIRIPAGTTFRINSDFDLYLLVSNFQSNVVVNEITMGTVNQVESLVNKKKILDLISIGFLAASALSYFIIFFLRRKEKAPPVAGPFLYNHCFSNSPPRQVSSTSLS